MSPACSLLSLLSLNEPSASASGKAITISVVGPDALEVNIGGTLNSAAQPPRPSRTTGRRHQECHFGPLAATLAPSVAVAGARGVIRRWPRLYN
eukprot:scaffold103793_cov65-Phaeocystis_antarctica.AAC.6